MNSTPNILDPLLEKVEEYGKSSIELIKLKIIDKISTLIAIIFANIFLLIILILFLSIANIGLSIYIGLLLGKIYLGFFCLSAFYGIVALIFYFFGIKITLRLMKKRMASLLLS